MIEQDYCNLTDLTKIRSAINIVEDTVCNENDYISALKLLTLNKLKEIESELEKTIIVEE